MALVGLAPDPPHLSTVRLTVTQGLSLSSFIKALELPGREMAGFSPQTVFPPAALFSGKLDFSWRGYLPHILGTQW